jgi:hypothetical protein
MVSMPVVDEVAGELDAAGEQVRAGASVHVALTIFDAAAPQFQGPVLASWSMAMAAQARRRKPWTGHQGILEA